MKEHYLDISKEQKEQIEQLFFSGDSWKKEWDNEEKTKSIYSATSRIRLILDILADYTEHPDDLPEDTDFAIWFLKEGKLRSFRYGCGSGISHSWNSCKICRRILRQ